MTKQKDICVYGGDGETHTVFVVAEWYSVCSNCTSRLYKFLKNIIYSYGIYNKLFAFMEASLQVVFYFVFVHPCKFQAL